MAAGKNRSTDERFMRRALALARKGEGNVSPNPLVGAVIVRDGRIIAEGFHQCCGENHAEIDAIRNATETIAGATFYITLEPCSHYGRTPPCVEALIAHRPGRVVVGAVDPNPLVSGRGIKALKQSGIETEVGVLEEACRESNRVFFKYIRTGLPYVTLKFAQTLDGRVAAASGHSHWISSPPSLRFAHRLRAVHDAILVGAGTVLADNPELTCRLVRGRDPLRIVVDSHLSLSPDATVFSDGKRTLAATTRRAPAERRRLLEKKGIEVLEIGEDPAGRVDLHALLMLLGKREISSLLVEGGATVATSFLKENLADRLIVILAPKIVGEGINAVGDLGIRRMDDALGFSFQRVTRYGEDLILDARISRPATKSAAQPPGSRRGRS
ncbi:MAG: bifunctional diaminohydroxyphosphoribosylaminopyrimidine deaminase/5-amino-6-(5-phosphoribosylamino)uracil reductase RibD [Deltaproteobacteria bacterium]|nr:bifunctional diaminohydroxyphosphoribosylaminopyrimidine deaminase/5-amino-6-(5-phosphoribosylamino)uracil reductase RibD [Deltaproteobacteria bacterium]